MNFVKALALGSALVASSAFAQGQLRLESAQSPATRAGGPLGTNGCPSGSYDYTVSSDSQFIQVRFYQMNAETVNGQGFDEKTCQLTINAQVAPDYRFALDATEVRGHASVSDQSGSGTIESSYYPDAYARFPVTLMNLPFRGPYETDFQVSNQLQPRELQFTSCDGNPNKRVDLLTRLSVRSDGFGQAAITEHRLDRAIVQTYRVVWDRCGGGGGGGGGGMWYGTCRVVHETVWGKDLHDFWGRSQARSQQDATMRARQDGQYQCERARNNDSLTRCVVDQNNCTATR